jgi:hypothetical protein
MTTSGPDKPALPAGVELEYRSLRDEILLRINLRQQLVWYTLALSGALVGVGLQSPRLSLLYPPFAFFLALGWLQNDYRIRDVSAYIRKFIEPMFSTVGWETLIKEERDAGEAGWRIIVFSHGGVLLVTQLIALSVGLTTPAKQLLEWSLIALGGLAVAGVLWIWIRSLANRLASRSTKGSRKKIVICGRMAHKQQLYNLGLELEATKDFDVVIPQGARQPPVPEQSKEDEFKYYFKEITDADAIVVLNLDKSGMDGYIGGNTFLEMGFAYVLNKRIILWDTPSSQLPYLDEIQRVNPIILPQADVKTLISRLCLR